jgi:hypothetical protein
VQNGGAEVQNRGAEVQNGSAEVQIGKGGKNSALARLRRVRGQKSRVFVVLSHCIITRSPWYLFLLLKYSKYFDDTSKGLSEV